MVTSIALMTIAIGVALLFVNERYNSASLKQYDWSSDNGIGAVENPARVLARWVVNFAGIAAITGPIFLLFERLG